ncbi:unnamed protein product [Thelazia callipaeda]|uniref:Col_cuticle_N domain-containing protein n=1 Tax=Thelazia callipaeda TaxID=103827 RepID=A0A0N5D8I8_THECL|nr:unnamed protein product [Thelazia callipaeda]
MDNLKVVVTLIKKMIRILILYTLIILLAVTKQSFAMFNYYKQLSEKQAELLHFNSNMLYNLEIKIGYPPDTKHCNGPQITIFDNQWRYACKFQLDKKKQIWKAESYIQSQTQYLSNEQYYLHRFIWLFSINHWRIKVKWNGGKATFFHNYGKFGHEICANPSTGKKLAILIVQESCELERVLVAEYLIRQPDKNELQHAANAEESMTTINKLNNMTDLIYAILVPGAVLAIVISTVMMTVEIRIYALYQTAKSRPIQLVITRDFMKDIHIQRERQKG